MNPSEPRWRAWAAKAENDRLDIRNNLAASCVPWDAVCFHAQQAAEKMLKALLSYHERQPPRIHDLVVLFEECRRLVPALEDLAEDCDLLNDYAVEARYPGDLISPGEADGRAAAAAADRISSAIARHLPQEHNSTSNNATS